MDFNQTDDRRMLSDTLKRYLSESYNAETRNKIAYDAPFHSEEKWAQLAELGVLGAFLTEDQGGFAGEGFDIAVIFEELGRSLCPEPMLGSLMGLRLLAGTGEDALIEAVIGGEKKLAFAVYEPENYDDISTLETRENGGKLNGRKSVVYGAPSADVFLVAARSSDGIGLYLAEAKHAEVISYAMIDGGGAGEVIFNDTPAKCLANNAIEKIESALDVGRLALCAEAVGTMDQTLALLVDYMGQRKQFGRTLSSFQALQHRVVDMMIELEQCRSAVILAASKLSTPERARYVSLAKNIVSRTSTLIAEESVQMHGGIGMTWEYPGAHYAKRLTMIDHQLGDRYFHSQRFIEAKEVA